MFALKKNENTVSFTVRLNLNRPEHARAYELLKNSPHSRTATIVDALTAEPPAPEGIADADALKEIVRQAVSDAIRDLPLAVQPEVLSVTNARKNLSITLDDGFLMSPSKSVTAFAGIEKV